LCRIACPGFGKLWRVAECTGGLWCRAKCRLAGSGTFQRVSEALLVVVIVLMVLVAVVVIVIIERVVGVVK